MKHSSVHVISTQSNPVASGGKPVGDPPLGAKGLLCIHRSLPLADGRLIIDIRRE